MTATRIDHSAAFIYINDKGIVWFKFKNNAEITLEVAREFAGIMEEICDGEARRFVFDTRDSYGAAMMESRKYLAHDEHAIRWRKADAILVNSLHNRILANFYLKIASNKRPARVFGSEKAALKWLERF